MSFKLTGLPLGKLLSFIAIAASLTAVSSCSDDDSNKERSEKIEVYLTPDYSDEEPVTEATVNVEGGDVSFYVKSNVEFTPTWQDSETSPWAKIKSCTQTGDGLYEVVLHTARRYKTAYYTRRQGTLLLSSPELDYGVFVTVNQGFVAELSNNFSWLKYGSSDPRKLDGTLISQWSSSLKNYGYTSTVINGESEAWCYGKNGYIMLGDDKGHGADIITPYVESFRTDSLLILSFKAVAYTSVEGVKDANKLTVSITGGGVITDQASSEGTTLSFDVPYYDMTDEEFPNSMWNGTDYLIFIQSTPLHPITSNTQIRFIAGDMSSAGSPNRIFLDNIYIRKPADQEEFDNYFKLNSGSGTDVILGKETEDNDSEI